MFAPHTRVRYLGSSLSAPSRRAANPWHLGGEPLDKIALTDKEHDDHREGARTMPAMMLPVAVASARRSVEVEPRISPNDKVYWSLLCS